ncbi:hypothetical protein HDR59_00620 [bacterium]|nr:hypothetical protein [bacterium]
MNKKVLLVSVMSLFLLNACGNEKTYKEGKSAFCEGFFSYSDYVCIDKDGNPISGIMYSKRGDKYTFKNGKLDGIAKFYDEGKLWYETEFKNGEIDGAQKEYYPNGRLKSKKIYKNGKLVE